MTLRHDETQPEEQHPEPADIGAPRPQGFVGDRGAEPADAGNRGQHELSTHSVLQSVLIGCRCAFWVAMVFVAIETRTLIRNLDARTEQAATGAYHLAEITAQTEATQNVYWRATSLQTSRLIGQARHAMEDVDTSVQSLNTLVRNTDASLNGKKGVLPALAASSDAIGTSVVEMTAHATPALDEAAEAAQSASRVAKSSAILVEQVTPPAVDTLKHVDGVTAHVDHVSDHYDSVLTAKQSTWDKIKASIWLPIKVAIRVW